MEKRTDEYQVVNYSFDYGSVAQYILGYCSLLDFFPCIFSPPLPSSLSFLLTQQKPYSASLTVERSQEQRVMRLQLAHFHCILSFQPLHLYFALPPPPFTTHSQSLSRSLLPGVKQGVIHQRGRLAALSPLLRKKGDEIKTLADS